jgi:diacylglycerol kinase family enzyme
MAHKTPRVTLIHNPTAGGGEHAAERLVAAIERAGYTVRYYSSKEVRISKVLDRPCEIVAIAGGDGTIRKVAVRARPDGPPLAILPLGTANNIAKSLGVSGQPGRLAAGWKEATERPYHRIGAEGEWGCRRLIEGIGFGAIARAVEAMSDEHPPPDEARERFCDFVAKADPVELDIVCDGAAVSGAFVSVEITKIPLVGPNLLLAPKADPSDCRVEISCVPAAEEDRRRFGEWLAGEANGEAAPVWSVVAAKLSVEGQFIRVRLDDKARRVRGKGTISVAAEAEPLRFLVSHYEEPDSAAHAGAGETPSSK